jgi:hypothetical protein
MPNALDMFREQRDAAHEVHARLQEVAALLKQLREQVDGVAGNVQLRTLLKDEQTWLARTQAVLAEVRRLREQEVARFWPAVWRRWVVALVFALASTAAAGAGYAWVTQPYARERNALLSRAELADVITRRLLAMTPAERRQFDVLMKWQASAR